MLSITRIYIGVKSMAELKIGSKSPTFALTNQDNQKISLKDIKEDFIVLFFYPKDNTPGCTIEAKSFTKQNKIFKKQNTAAFGISGGDLKSKIKFCEKAGLDIPLLIDTDGAVGTKYGVYGEKTFMGKKYIGFSRKTFILDSEKKIIHIFDKVKPEGHAEEVLKIIKSCK